MTVPFFKRIGIGVAPGCGTTNATAIAPILPPQHTSFHILAPYRTQELS